MPKYLVMFLLLSASALLRAQHGTFNKPLNREDTAFLKKTATECFHFNPSLRFSYNHDDLGNKPHTKGDLPANEQNLALLRQQAIEHPADAEAYTELSGMYSRLGKAAEARDARRKAFETITAALAAHPDSAQARITLGSIYLSALQMDSALANYKRAVKLEPLNEDANRLVPFIHILNNHFDSAYAFINKQINAYPDSYESHEALPVYYIYKFYDQLNKYRQLRHPDEEKLRPENLITLKLLKDYSERDPRDFKREYLYRVTYQVCYSTYITFKTVNDSLFNPKQIRFSTTLKDAANLKQQEDFFKRYLKGKIPGDKYLVHKALGNIYLLSNRPQEALPYLKKAIKLKPVKHSTVGNNASEDYDNLITAYFLLKDTAGYEKTIRDKIRLQPAIDYSAADFITAGKISVSRKQYATAETDFSRAISIDAKQPDAYLGLALVKFLQNDPAGALTNINEAFKLDDQKWELYILYGIVSLCNRDPNNAFEAFKEGSKRHNSTWIKTDLMEKYFDLY